MANWFHRLMNPHCPHCMEERDKEFERRRLLHTEEKQELEDDAVCPSCETLRRQLEIANHQNEALLSRLLEKPSVPERTEPPVITKPKMMSWNVRRQMLEAEDRHRANLLRKAPTPDAPVDVSDLEQEVLEVEKEREA